MKPLSLFIALMISSSTICMEKKCKSNQELTFEQFTTLCPELQIYTFNTRLIDIVNNHYNPVKALKKALNFTGSIKCVNHNFYSYKKILSNTLKELMKQKFVPEEITMLNQEQKDQALVECLSASYTMVRSSYETTEQLNEATAKLETYSEQLVHYLLSGANPQIIIDYITAKYHDIDASTFETQFFSKHLFIAMCYGAKLDTNFDKFNTKDLLLTWAIENVTNNVVHVIKFLLKSRVNLNNNVYKRGGDWKFLHIIAYNTNVQANLKFKVAKLLLDFGAQKDLRTIGNSKKDNGYTAYDLARLSENHNPELLELLQIDDKTNKKEARCLVC